MVRICFIIPEIFPDCTHFSFVANYTNFYFKILKTPDVPISCIFAYISELYSKSWNEAVVKSHFGANIVVFYEAWSNIDEQSLSLDAVYSNQPQRIQASPKEIINTNDLLSKFENSLKENKIIVVDDYPEGAAQLPTYNYVAVGGSFDQLHNGHKKLLYVSSLICLKELTVGITADNMLTKKTHSEEIQKFPERFANVQNFLQLMHSTLSLNLVEITDPFGPAITDAKIQALIVSSETIAGGFKINEIRTSKNMKRLDLIVISRSDSAILSSTFLRKQRLLRQQEQS